MKYRTHYRKYRWFVYRCPVAGPLDIRCPIGGITSHGHDEIEAYDIAYRRANQRYPTRPGELLQVAQVTSAEERRQAWSMEKSWQREMVEFESLMTVGSHEARS